jgi:hypothetical protein
MSRFYFHLYDDIAAEDEEGLNLSSEEEAVAVKKGTKLNVDATRGGIKPAVVRRPPSHFPAKR